MSALEDAVADIAAELDRLGIPYMLIGGLAVSAWGEPRSTLDVDVTIWATETQHAATELGRVFTAAISSPVEFLQRTRVLPLLSSQGVRIDVLFAAFPFEKEMIDRAEVKGIGRHSVRVASVADLILLKAISLREKDRRDVERLWARFRDCIDREYLETRLGELAEALDRPDLMELLRS